MYLRNGAIRTGIIGGGFASNVKTVSPAVRAVDLLIRSILRVSFTWLLEGKENANHDKFNSILGNSFGLFIYFFLLKTDYRHLKIKAMFICQDI